MVSDPGVVNTDVVLQDFVCVRQCLEQNGIVETIGGQLNIKCLYGLLVELNQAVDFIEGTIIVALGDDDNVLLIDDFSELKLDDAPHHLCNDGASGVVGNKVLGKVTLGYLEFLRCSIVVVAAAGTEDDCDNDADDDGDEGLTFFHDVYLFPDVV